MKVSFGARDWLFFTYFFLTFSHSDRHATGEDTEHSRQSVAALHS